MGEYTFPPFIVCIRGGATEEDVKKLSEDLNKAGFKNFAVTKLDVSVMVP